MQHFVMKIITFGFVIICIFLHSAYCKKKELDPRSSLIFGPGLQSDVVIPVRYFYIQAVDMKGKNFTRSLGQQVFTIAVESGGGRVRAWKEVLDRNDGSYIVRMRLYETYKDLNIDIKYKGQHVAKSPYILKGLIYHEGCNCPEHDSTKWLSDMSCPATNHQITRDLSPFPSIDLVQMKKDAIERFGTNNAVCHYSIIDNEVYRKCYGEHVGFAQFMDAWLFSMARKIKLPDIEFFSNLGDWPLSTRNRPPIPVLSWCGSDETYDIVMPTYDLTESTLEALGRVSLDMLSVQGNTGPIWKKKIEKGFFRGRDSRQERLDLTVLGRSKPELFDVGMTNFFFFDYDEEKYGPKNQHVSFFEFFKYKYQLNVDGTVAAYRLPYLLAGNSLVFKQDSSYYEHFYHDLEPMTHYVPFKRDISDVEGKLKWAKSHDAEAKRIALAGQMYARDNLMAAQLYCYSFSLFKEFASRLKQKPTVHPEQEHIKMPVDEDSKCQCGRKAPVTNKKTKKKTVKKEKVNKHVEL